LITPSLDEMVHVAKELERNKLQLPLLIGGATTSRRHTAVKISPQRPEPVIHVLDASRAVGVVSNLLQKDEEKKRAYVDGIREEYTQLTEKRMNRKKKVLLSEEEANRNKFEIDWREYTPPTPNMLGTKVWTSYPVSELRKYIDWTPFFRTWELAGRFPKILEDEVVGMEARKLYRDAQRMLDEIEEKDYLQPKGVMGLFPAQRHGDNEIDVFDPESGELLDRCVHLRQRSKKAKGRPNYCLADYIAPEPSGRKDYLGAFAVTAGHGIEPVLSKFKADHDDYNAILLQALADRLAEAFAERLHERVRKEFWGYEPNENLDNTELIKEKYKGIRPAPGYPACPVHEEKLKLFSLLDVENTVNIRLTESYAMYPAASVSGWYFSHPESRYFKV